MPIRGETALCWVFVKFGRRDGMRPRIPQMPRTVPRGLLATDTKKEKHRSILAGRENKRAENWLIVEEERQELIFFAEKQ